MNGKVFADVICKNDDYFDQIVFFFVKILKDVNKVRWFAFFFIFNHFDNIFIDDKI